MDCIGFDTAWPRRYVSANRPMSGDVHSSSSSSSAVVFLTERRRLQELTPSWTVLRTGNRQNPPLGHNPPHVCIIRSTGEFRSEGILSGSFRDGISTGEIASTGIMSWIRCERCDTESRPRFCCGLLWICWTTRCTTNPQHNKSNWNLSLGKYRYVMFTVNKDEYIITLCCCCIMFMPMIVPYAYYSCSHFAVPTYFV